MNDTFKLLIMTGILLIFTFSVLEIGINMLFKNKCENGFVGNWEYSDRLTCTNYNESYNYFVICKMSLWGSNCYEIKETKG